MKYATKLMFAVLLALAVSLAFGAPVTAVNVLTFGAKCDGATNDAAAIQKANDALTSGGTILLPQATCFIGGTTINLGSNVVLQGAGMGASIISSNNGDVSQIRANTKTLVAVRDLTINVTVAGTTSQVGGIAFATTTYSSVERVEIIGVSWAGVYIGDGSNYNVVRNIYAHNFRGTVQDSADVAVQYNAKYNIVAENRLYGGNWHGVLVQDAGGASLPQKNLVTGNRVGQHIAYGIAIYQATSADTYTEVTNNYIEDIQGTALSGTAGACIYVVGAGGVLVQGNTVRNCAVQTSSLTLTPAGIGVNMDTTSLAPVNVIGNVVDNVTKYFGIYAVSKNPGGINIVGNSVRVPAANTQGYAAIGTQDSIKVNISSNTITIVAGATGQIGVYVYASSQNSNDILIANNLIDGADYGSILLTRAASNTINRFVVTGNLCVNGTAANIPSRIDDANNGTVTGNYFVGSNNTATVYHNAVTNTRYANNILITSGTNGVNMAGTSTGSFWDRSNLIQGAVANTSAGGIVYREGNAAPASGSCGVGDRVDQNVPAVGQPKGWRCTGSGTPGTWTSEGNL